MRNPRSPQQPKDALLRQWGQNIREFRVAFGLTQKEVGDKLIPSVTQATVARWEGGLAEPRRQHKSQLCTLFQTDVRILFPLAAA